MKLWCPLLILFLAGCSVLPLRPGRASFRTPSGWEGNVRQSQNPQQETTQEYERVNGSTTERVKTKIGAAQKDSFREAAAKLSALRPLLWVGLLLFVGGIASAVWPPLKLIVGSLTTSGVIAAAGLALMVLPSLIVGNELLILGAAALGVFAWFFAHRHGKLRGELETLKK